MLKGTNLAQIVVEPGKEQAVAGSAIGAQTMAERRIIKKNIPNQMDQGQVWNNFATRGLGDKADKMQSQINKINVELKEHGLSLKSESVTACLE